jgi:hypothetical protein
MNNLIRLLILIVLLEIILGYALYLRDSPRMTGNYISSTLYVLDKIKLDKKLKEKKGKFGAQRRKLEEAEERRKLEEAEERRKLEEAEERRKLEEAEEQRILVEAEEQRILAEAEEKRILAEAEEMRKLEKASCEEYINLNRVLTIGDFGYHRKPMKIQTSNYNLNISDFSDKYIIVIAGNSEALGISQKKQERLHSKLEEKLKNKFQSDNIIVFNLSDTAFFLNGQLHALQNFSKIYNPDLVIFYTGGNEMRLHTYVEDMVSNGFYLNLDNGYWYKFFKDNKIYQKCLNNKIFLTQLNFLKKRDSIDISRYINNGFLKIKEYFSNINANFIVYLHPLNKEKEEVQEMMKEFQDIKILDKRFINLSNEDLNLEFDDAFHTRDSNIMASKILEDIILNHEQKIINKINISSK